MVTGIDSEDDDQPPPDHLPEPNILVPPEPELIVEGVWLETDPETQATLRLRVSRQGPAPNFRGSLQLQPFFLQNLPAARIRLGSLLLANLGR